MKVHYKQYVEEQGIDINKLRPEKSYDYLIANRNHALKKILDDTGNIPQEYLENRRCPSCRYDKYRFTFNKDLMQAVACDNCGLVFINPVLKEDICKSIYRSNEYAYMVKKIGEDSHFYRKERFGTERVDNIEKYHNPTLPKRLLEIGCSTGFLLEAAQERG